MQSERIPCLHLVGLPATQAFKQGKLLHHTLGDGDLGVFVGMSKAVGGGSAVGVIGLGSEGLEDEAWTETVDRVMRVAMAEVSTPLKEFRQIGMTDQDVPRTRFSASTSIPRITSGPRFS
jgi:TPP-dependent 2-oxoacid decarboxylase